LNGDRPDQRQKPEDAVMSLRALGNFLDGHDRALQEVSFVARPTIRALHDLFTNLC
jgi:hypothetical protein